jgi:ketosteroid isomerase-like protein
MSRENVEVTYRYMEGFNAEGLSGIERFWDPAVTWHTDPNVPEPGVYTGCEALRTYLQGFLRALGVFKVEIHDVIDLGEHDVLAITTVAGHPLGATTRETQFLNWAFVLTFREGKIVRIRSFFDKARAFEAVGLLER